MGHFRIESMGSYKYSKMEKQMIKPTKEDWILNFKNMYFFSYQLNASHFSVSWFYFNFYTLEKTYSNKFDF